MARSALKYLYANILKLPAPVLHTRTRKPRKLPTVLNSGPGSDGFKYNSKPETPCHDRNDVRFRACGSARLSALMLEMSIFQETVLHVHQSKNLKDRITVLSPLLTDYLKLITENRQSKEFLFLTQCSNRYSVRTHSVRTILQAVLWKVEQNMPIIRISWKKKY